MGDRDHRARVLLQVLLEPQHTLGVEVVGRLVEQQQIRLLEQQFAQRDSASLTAGEHAHVGIGRWAAQRVHGLLELGVEIPGVLVVELGLELAHLGEQRVVVGVGVAEFFRHLVEPGHQGLGLGHAVFDVAEHGLRLVEFGFLRKDSDGEPRRHVRLAVARMLDAGHDLEHAGLARAVRPDDADLRAGQERQGDVVEDDLLAVRLAGFSEDIDELRHDRRVYGTASCRSVPVSAPTAS